MKHDRSLGFETLESRQLLSSGQLAVADTAPTSPGSLVLNGTLHVSYGPQESSLTTNPNESLTRTVAVAGHLGSLGRVRGTWSESVDMYGNYDGPDKLVVGNSKGAIVITFFNRNPWWASIRRRRPVSYEHTQQILAGSKAYAGASETGTIVLTTKPWRTRVFTLTLHTTSA